MEEVVKGIREMKEGEERSFIVQEDGVYFELIIRKEGDHVYPKEREKYICMLDGPEIIKNKWKKHANLLNG